MQQTYAQNAKSKYQKFKNLFKGFQHNFIRLILFSLSFSSTINNDKIEFESNLHSLIHMFDNFDAKYILKAFLSVASENII